MEPKRGPIPSGLHGIFALHETSREHAFCAHAILGEVLIDVSLDHAGVPGGVDLAWQPKQFLGAPVPSAHLATLNLAQVVIAIEFTAVEIAETANDDAISAPDAALLDLPVIDETTAANDDAERVA